MRQSTSITELGWKAASAISLASIANVLVLYAGLTVLDIPSAFVGGQFGPLGVLPVLINTIFAVLGATVVYVGILKISARPNRAFRITATIVLVFSFGMFASPHIVGAPLSMFAVLGLMHILTACIVVGIFTRFGRAGRIDS